MTPYYQDDAVTLYHGDCREVVTQRFLHEAAFCVVTDPPYPNNAGHFTADVEDARWLLEELDCETIAFWSELERPPVCLTLVAVHIWHRANVNGRPYEPAFHFSLDGEKRRSEVLRHAAIFNGAGPGCAEYLGHPTQKPVALMQRLIEKTAPAIVLDPFAGVGSTLRAAKNLGRKAIGIEIEERYCEIAVERLAQEVLVLT
jgi:site-specific DNA-methyltransferase (adenine-specific)